MATSAGKHFWQLAGPSMMATLGMLIGITSGYYWSAISFGPLVGASGLLLIIGAVVVDVRRGLDDPQRRVNAIVHSGMFVLSLLIYVAGLVFFYLLA